MPGNPLSNPNWAPQLADTVERVVGQVRDNATTKVVVVVRGLVFGIIIGAAAITSLMLGLIIGTKFLQRLVNIGGAVDANSSVWVSYLLMSVLLAIAGMVCMRKRATPDSATTSR
jgi:hypothetical protein